MKQMLVVLLCLLVAIGSMPGVLAEEAGEPEKIVMSFPTWAGPPADLAEVQEAMNAITRKTIGVEVELQLFDYASYPQQMTLMISGGEPLDIIGTLNFNYSNAVRNGYLTDLEADGLYAQYGQGIAEAIDPEYINACRVGGKLYGIPNNRDMAQGRGCVAIAAKYLDGIGYEYDKNVEIIQATEDEIGAIYEKLHAAYPDLIVYSPTTSSMQQFSNVDLLGGTVYGVLLNYGRELKVENLFDSEYYWSYCRKMHNYYALGYISSDASSDTTAVTELVKSGASMSYTTGGKPGIKQQETNLCGTEMVIFQTMEDYTSSAEPSNFPWAIPVTTQNPVAAMKYLNELFTNADLMNLISWGIEGKHYKLLDSGLITYADGVDAANSGYNLDMGWMFPNQLLTHIWDGNSLELWDRIREFNKNAERSSALGFNFDTTNVIDEMTAVENVYNEYKAQLEYGFTDPEVGIPEMNEKLKLAGLDKIIAEKQTQLDAWAASR